MKRHAWLIHGAFVLMACVAVGAVEGGVIYPVNPATRALDPNSPVTLSLLDVNGGDVTDSWLPSWEPAGGRTVYLAVNSMGRPVTPTSIILVPPLANPAFDGVTNPFLNPLTTSAYPGRCTNFGSPADLSADYTTPDPWAGQAIDTVGGPRTAYPLTSQDCGGLAVVQVVINGTSYTFVVPQDSNLNGTPDIWETKFCPNDSCRTGQEDNDSAPVAGGPIGDGIAAFDEYRGFIVSLRHTPTDPRQKDVFVHLVNPQCGGPSLLGGADPTYPSDGTPIFANLDTLIVGSQIHTLGYVRGQENGTTNEWVDWFVSFTQQTGFQYLNAAGTVTGTPPADDRRINANALFPLGIPNPAGGGPIQKGLRVTECVDTSATAPLGTTGIGSPTGGDNSLVYTQRIVNYINGLIDAGQGRRVRLFAFEQGAWVQKYQGTGSPTQGDRDYIISQAMKFYVAHEPTHSTRLTPTVEGTRKTSYGYHHAPGTGSLMDQAIVQKIDKSVSGFSSFYIPSFYSSGDQGSFRLLD